MILNKDKEESSFMKKYIKKTRSNGDENSNHDFLAAIPLSPKSASDCALSDLSSSYWSGRISANLEFEETQKKHSSRIPKLDLKNLPPDSDEEEQQQLAQLE